MGSVMEYHESTNKAPWRLLISDLQEKAGRNDTVLLMTSPKYLFIYDYYSIRDDIIPLEFKDILFTDKISLDYEVVWIIKSNNFPESYKQKIYDILYRLDYLNKGCSQYRGVRLCRLERS